MEKYVINGGTTLQYGHATNGGAVYANGNASVTVSGVYDTDGKEPTVKFINCAATDNYKPNGGAIRAVNLEFTNNIEEKGRNTYEFIAFTSACSGCPVRPEPSHAGCLSALLNR